MVLSLPSGIGLGWNHLTWHTYLAHSPYFKLYLSLICYIMQLYLMAYNVLDLHSVLCLCICFPFCCFSLVGYFSLESSCPKGDYFLNRINSAAMPLPQQRFLWLFDLVVLQVGRMYVFFLFLLHFVHKSIIFTSSSLSYLVCKNAEGKPE